MPPSVRSIRTLYRENKFEELVPAAQSAVPSNAEEQRELLWLRTVSLHRLGRSVEAVDLARQGMEQFPENETFPGFLVERDLDAARALLQQEKFADTLSALDTLDAPGARHRRKLLWLRTMALHRSGRSDKALQQARQAAAEFPDDKSFPSFLADRRLEAAKALFQRKLYNQALGALGDSGSGRARREALWLRVQALHELGHADVALELAREAARDFPDDKSFLGFLADRQLEAARALFQGELFRETLSVLDNNAGTGRTRREASWLQVQALHELGHAEAALELSRELAAEFPDDKNFPSFVAGRQLEAVAALTQKKLFAEALAGLESIDIRTEHHRREAAWLSAQALHDSGRSGEAFEQAQRSAARFPGDRRFGRFLAQPEFDHCRDPQLIEILQPPGSRQAATPGSERLRQPKLWFLFRPTEHRDAVIRWADQLGGRVSFVFQTADERWQTDLSPHATRHVVGDLVTTNSEDEEYAFKAAWGYFDAVSACFEPVDFQGVDLRSCLKWFPKVRPEYLVRTARALERMRGEDVEHVVFYFSRFSAAYYAILEEAAALGLCDLDNAALEVIDGSVTPVPQLSKSTSPEVCLPSYTRKWEQDSDELDSLLANLPPLQPGGVHILATTEGANYLPYIGETILTLIEAGLPYRVLAGSAVVRDELLSVLGKKAVPEDRMVVLPNVQNSRHSSDAGRIERALTQMFSQVGPRIAKMPEVGEESRLGDLTLHYAWRYFNVSQIIFNAYDFCLQLERLNAFLAHDRPACLYTYPALSPYDPAPVQLMRARGGVAASGIYLSVTAEYRNLIYPQFDKVHVLGTAQTEILASRGYPEDQIVEIGVSLLDVELAKWTRAKARAFLADVLGRDTEEGPLILVATSGFRQADEFTWLRWLADALRHDSGATVVVKLHRSTHAAPYEEFVRGLGNANMIVTQKGEIFPYLSASDIVITDISHAGKLAVYAEKKLWVANISGEPFPYSRFDEQGVALLAASPEDFADIVAEAEGEKTFVRSTDDVERFIRREFTANDGKARERMKEFFRACVSGR